MCNVPLKGTEHVAHHALLLIYEHGRLDILVVATALGRNKSICRVWETSMDDGLSAPGIFASWWLFGRGMRSTENHVRVAN